MSTGAGGSGGGMVPPPPPEREERRDFEAPRAGARFVYVANPKRDTVAVIDSQSLSTRSVDVGDTPTFIWTLPGKDVALVINVGSKDLSILRTDAGGTRVSTVKIVPGANTISIAPGGRHAIAWYNAASAPGTTAAAAPAAGSFQDVSLIVLAEDKDTALPMTVGFRPSAVVFAGDGSAGFVVTEDGVSVIRFADVREAQVAPLVSLDPTATIVWRDVSVTPDGRYAVARRQDSAVVQMVDIGARTTTIADLGSFVTDLDLSPCGDYALAVLRVANTVVRIPIPEGFTDGGQRQLLSFEGETIGSASITHDCKTAVLYTTAATPMPVERIVIAPITGVDPPRPVRLKKAVRAIAVAPDSSAVLVVHTKVAGDPLQPGIDVETMIDRAYGYSVVDLRTGFAKLQLSPTDVGPLAITPDASRAFVLLRDDAQSIRIAQRINLSSLLVDDFLLGSPPQSIAALADSRRVFVSQQHAEGRISFIHWESGAVDSVTGFELNGRIVQ